MMRIDILTLFPAMFAALNQSIIGRAQEKKIIDIKLHNFRDYAQNKQKHVDDYPYGGTTAGMLLALQPIFDNLAQIENETSKLNKKIILLDPAGTTFTQKKAEELTNFQQLIFICGHYEGIDERIKTLVTDEISVGDYVLTGGELPTMTIIDAVVRLIPGVLGNQFSPLKDSYASGLLEEDQFTRPANFRGLKVPDVLLSGDHEKIRQWRLLNSLTKTYQKRPEMLKNIDLTEEMQTMLEEIMRKKQ